MTVTVPPAAPGTSGRTASAGNSAPPPTPSATVQRASLREAVMGPLRSLECPHAPYYLLLGAVVMLASLGIVMVLSASAIRSYDATQSSFSIVRQQAMWLGLGLPLMLVAMRMPPRVWRLLAYPALLLAVVLLALVPLIGREVNGNTNWIQVAGFTLQPSEPAKLALALWGADLLARKHRLLGEWKHLLVPLVPVTGLLLLLVMLGGDLGTALIISAIMAGLLFVAGAPLKTFAWMGALGVAAVLLLSVLPGTRYRMARITSWLDPSSADLSAIGYQALHGKYALGTGGLFGVGLGASREKMPSALPEAHTDFIYAIIGEELGLAGTVTVLLLFAAIGYAGFRIALQAKDLFVSLAAGAVTTWILVQALVNIGAVIGVLPITGVPLPLISYGGSALVPTMVALGMLLSFARHNLLGGGRGPRPRGTSERVPRRTAQRTPQGVARGSTV